MGPKADEDGRLALVLPMGDKHGARDIAESRALAPGLHDFGSWVRKHRANIPLD